MRADFHIHSQASLDCFESMDAMVQAAIAKGLDAICFTDHCDPLDCRIPGKKSTDSRPNWLRSYKAIAEARAKWGDQIEILHGMELGEIPLDLEQTREFAASPNLDFILGSIHMLAGMQDFYLLDYTDPKRCKALAEAYIDDNIRMAEADLVDVVAHIGFLNRYMKPQGQSVDFMEQADKLRHLFQILIQNGRGIELNTSGLRQGTGCTFPDLPILRLYKECGGEIITIGSDAHRPADIASHFDEGYALLKAAGFQYQTIFRQRKPEFIKL